MQNCYGDWKLNKDIAVVTFHPRVSGQKLTSSSAWNDLGAGEMKYLWALRSLFGATAVGFVLFLLDLKTDVPETNFRHPTCISSCPPAKQSQQVQTVVTITAHKVWVLFAGWTAKLDELLLVPYVGLVTALRPEVLQLISSFPQSFQLQMYELIELISI